MTSGRARPKGWRLVFERRTAPVIEPLMGYTGGGDTLTQVELDFRRFRRPSTMPNARALPISSRVIRRPRHPAAHCQMLRNGCRPVQMWSGIALSWLG
ncbi:NADH dehydrogenase ubiquinone Fe-S protein 4 [Mesorhizobium sp.]|uniref:NADH dehydrogenase ubiquinone Fe-S protein 4 n=1 Tax=Mesorhizobium sp. TaxID=1871066 RepID=UPI0025808E54|nr:NADH dehydrogenase ubiquinone Fe-S protein 4 [Mesorhizobium sp.]